MVTTGSNHRFHHPDLVEQRHERDFIRSHCPNGRDGFIAEDLDLVLRAFGPTYQTDGRGRIRLVEIKFGNASLGPSKRMTFGLIDEGLRKGLGPRYDGLYVVRTESRTWEESSSFNVNGTVLDRDEFVAWLNWDASITVKPLALKGT